MSASRYFGFSTAKRARRSCSCPRVMVIDSAMVITPSHHAAPAPRVVDEVCVNRVVEPTATLVPRVFRPESAKRAAGRRQFARCLHSLEPGRNFLDAGLHLSRGARSM